MNCSTPGHPVHHQLPEFTQTHVHRVSDAIQPSHPLSSSSPKTLVGSQQNAKIQTLKTELLSGGAVPVPNGNKYFGSKSAKCKESDVETEQNRTTTTKLWLVIT